MKKMTISFLSILLLCGFTNAFCGCSHIYKRFFPVLIPPSVPEAIIGYKSNKNIFEIDDVSLDFYCGSEMSNQLTPDSDGDLSFVTYMFFVSGETYTDHLKPYFSDQSHLPENEKPNDRLYDIIDLSDDIYICKTLYEDDEKPFYVNNTVRREFGNIKYSEAKDKWGEESAIYDITPTDQDYLIIPDVSYRFTIPSALFASNSGMILFFFVSFYTKNNRGDIFEFQVIQINYMKQGEQITLSSVKNNEYLYKK